MTESQLCECIQRKSVIKASSHPLKALIFLDGFDAEPELLPLSPRKACSRIMGQMIVKPPVPLSELFFQINQFLNQVQCFTLQVGPLLPTLKLLKTIFSYKDG